jgi:hypothetical protein
MRWTQVESAASLPGWNRPGGDAIARAAQSGGFLGVHPKRDCLYLQIVTDHAIRAARVTKVDPVSARRFHVHVRLVTQREVDGELLGWLREAYDLMA